MQLDSRYLLQLVLLALITIGIYFLASILTTSGCACNCWYFVIYLLASSGVCTYLYVNQLKSRGANQTDLIATISTIFLMHLIVSVISNFDEFGNILVKVIVLCITVATAIHYFHKHQQYLD